MPVNKIITPDNSSKDLKDSKDSKTSKRNLVKDLHTYNIIDQELETEKKENTWYIKNCNHVYNKYDICIYCGIGLNRVLMYVID